MDISALDTIFVDEVSALVELGHFILVPHPVLIMEFLVLDSLGIGEVSPDFVKSLVGQGEVAVHFFQLVGEELGLEVVESGLGFLGLDDLGL